MRKTYSVFLILFFLLRSFFPAAQLNTAHLKTSAATGMLLKEEQERFFDHLNKIPVDPAITDSLSGYIESETENIRLFIMSGISLSDPEKEKAMKSLIYFLKR